MKILLVTETLHTGGAETFIVRLANALQARGHRVFVFVVHPQLSKKEIVNSLHPEIKVTLFNQSNRTVKQKADSLFYRLKIDTNLLQHEATAALTALILKEGIEAVHSHLFGADLYVAKVSRKALPVFRHVSTHHGDYLLFQNKAPWNTLHYNNKLQQILQSLHAMAVISGPQQTQFEAFRRQGHPDLEVIKILNGYELPPTPEVTRESLGFAETDFVFGMVARGIAEKGWEQLIVAFENLADPKAKLLLVGEGPEVDRLRALHGSNKSICFAGYSANTAGYIKCFNVGVLPSRYGGESLPTVVIEYLACGKPVLASDIGEIKNMIHTPNGEPAGLLLSFNGKEIDVEQLHSHMKQLLEDSKLYRQLSQNTTAAFLQFNMETCVKAYEKLYQNA